MPQDFNSKNISQLIGDIKNALATVVDTTSSRRLSSPVDLSVLEVAKVKIEQPHIQDTIESDKEDKKSHLIEELQAKNTDLTQENNLLLLQLKILKDDLRNAFADLDEHSKKEAGLQNRLSRLQGLLPEIFEHGLLEVIDVVNSSAGQTATLRFTDFKVEDLSESEFLFQLESSSEGVGIWIDPQPGASQFFYPKRVNVDQQRNLYFSYTPQQWTNIRAAISGCLYCLGSQPKYFTTPANFDVKKWHGLVSKLSEQVTSLPEMPRFDAINLKREQINEDYEYIWFEIINLIHEDFSCPQFEIRFSATLIQEDGFSRFPKIEIPLVNGIHKPFPSWYAESSDDLGDKFEIRFALDNNSFDLKVWDRLSTEDKSILTLIILYFPQILSRLSLGTELTGRQWQDWLLLANQTSDVFKNFLTGKSQFATALKEDSNKGKLAPTKSQVKSFSVRPKHRG